MGEQLLWNRADAREFDRRAVEDYGIPSQVLMENAGRGASDWILAHALELGLSPGSSVAVLCGQGNNGGDGFVLARHLSLAGLTPFIAELGCSEKSRADRSLFKSICLRMGISVWSLKDALADSGPLGGVDRPSLWVDCVLGTGFKGPLSGAVKVEMESVCALMSDSSAPVVALDLPSGLDADSGGLDLTHIRAFYTLTFGAPKCGFYEPERCPALGEVHVLGLGAPLR